MSETPSTHTVVRPCVFCGRLTSHVGHDGAYEVNCPHCGSYQVDAGFYTLATTERSDIERLEDLQAQVAIANADGFRLMVPGGQRMPLKGS